MRMKSFPFLLTGLFFWSLALAKSPEIVATTEELASLARYVVGNHLSVEHLASGKTDTHHVELRPSYATKLMRAKVVIRNGVALDDWIFDVIHQSRNARLRPGQSGHINASEGIELLQVSEKKVSRFFGDVHPEGNSHYLLEPLNVMVVLSNLALRFSHLFPDKEALFKENLATWINALEKKRTEWKKQIPPGSPIGVYHDQWLYFAKAFDLKIVGTLEPKPGIPPTIKHTRAMIERFKAASVKTVLQANYFEKRTAQAVADRVDAKVVILSHQVGSVWGGLDYIETMDKTSKP